MTLPPAFWPGGGLAMHDREPTAEAGYVPPKYGKGDNLHPNPAGYKATGDAIDLKTRTTN
ncbi:MAG TPA: hypothetical protein VGG79_16460 [Roseiarcus sp.]